MEFDATSLYPSAMWNEKSVHPRKETSYAYAKNLNDELVEKFSNGSFSRGSGILKTKYFNPKNLIVQHLPVKEKESKIETICIRNAYIIDTLTCVDVHKIVKIGGNVIEIHEGVTYRESFKVIAFRKVIDKLFALGQKYKD